MLNLDTVGGEGFSYYDVTVTKESNDPQPLTDEAVENVRVVFNLMLENNIMLWQKKEVFFLFQKQNTNRYWFLDKLVPR